MSILRRLVQLVRGSANNSPDRTNDPRDALNDSYGRQLDMLAKVRRGVADVTTSRKRLEIQLTQLRQAADRLHSEAAQAVDGNHDDLAREILARRGVITAQIDDVTTQRDLLTVEEAKLTTTAMRLQAQVETFRTRKDTINATYTAAEAQTQIGETLSGISTEIGDADLALTHAQEATTRMQAHASALDELVVAGTLNEATTAGPAGIQASLDATAKAIGVESELAALKAERAAPAIDDTPAAG